MDDIVRQALAKWPNVPHCYGWLALDARGDWYMRDDRIQAQGAFPHPKGSRIGHDKLRAFIERNYDRDDRGAWFFQNGPQRVYVELELTPWVLRLKPGEHGQPPAVHTHTGRPFDVQRALTDTDGRVYLCDARDVGVLHSMDMGLLAEHAHDGPGRTALHLTSSQGGARDLPVQTVDAAALPEAFGFIRRPKAEPRA